MWKAATTDWSQDTKSRGIVFEFNRSNYYFNVFFLQITNFAVTGRPRGKSQAPTSKTKPAIIDLKNLKTMALEYCEITSHAFPDLKVNALQSLSLEGCEHINYAAIVIIVRNCPNIKTLNVSKCNKLEDTSIEVICQGLQKLRQLKINELPAVTDNMFEKIGTNAKTLRFLHMKGSCTHLEKRQEFAANLFKQLPSLRIVKLWDIQEVHRHDGVEAVDPIWLL